MCGRLSTALSSLPDKQSPSISRFRPLEGSSAQDQQTFAASNTLCAMRYYQSPAICESGYFSSEADGGFHGLHTSSLLGPAQNASWSGSQPWAETTFSSPAPCQGDSWSFDATSHPTNGSPCRQYPVLPSYVSPGYAVPTRALFSATERMTKSSQMQRPTPPPETFVESPYGHAATLPSMEPTSPFPANPGSQPEAELMDSSTATVDHSSMSKDQTNDVPYAKLIERALLEAKGNRLVLKDIYRWFEQNTNKADDTAFKGWQNSVRHNLSMNGVSLLLKARCQIGALTFFRLLEKSLCRRLAINPKKGVCGSLTRLQRSMVYSPRQDIGARMTVNASAKSLSSIPSETAVTGVEVAQSRRLQR